MKFRRNSIGIKLWKYFVMFALITLVLLWLLQIVFLQSFYNGMQLANVKRAAEKIAANIEYTVFEKGFCAELDMLSDRLEAAAGSLARLERSRRELLANITHDLKTPLTLISGYAEKIEDLSWEEGEECRSDAAVIKREAKRLTLLVNDILDYSVLQSGSVAFDLQPVDLGELAKNVLLPFRVVCEQQGLVLERQIGEGLCVMADEQRISQVFYNLVTNAITHAGRDKTVGLKMVRVGKNVRVQVYDHGRGIPQADIPHIWDRYFTSRERRRSENGTGLGLSIVKEILDAHKAQYGVASEEGQGSCFWFELPALNRTKSES